MIRKLKEMKLEPQMFVSFSCARVLLLVVTLLIVLYMDVERQHNEEDETFRSSAAYVSRSWEVVHMLERGCPDPEVERGLDLTHVLAESWAGHLQVDTEPGEGTLFTLTFTGKGEEK